jgi:anti-anti-sigma factor
MSNTAFSTTGPDFELSVEADKDDLVLRLHGDFDVSAAPTVLAAMEAGAEIDGCRRLVFELSDVHLLDSAGIGLLIRAIKLQETRGGTVIVRNPSRVARGMLELTRLADFVPIE